MQCFFAEHPTLNTTPFSAPQTSHQSTLPTFRTGIKTANEKKKPVFVVPALVGCTLHALGFYTLQHPRRRCSVPTTGSAFRIELSPFTKVLRVPAPETHSPGATFVPTPAVDQVWSPSGSQSRIARHLLAACWCGEAGRPNFCKHPIPQTACLQAVLLHPIDRSAPL